MHIIGYGKIREAFRPDIIRISDANISFDDLCQLLIRLGFEERVRGSHHIFRKDGVLEMINLQKDGSKAKTYQVRQIRLVLLKYKMRGEAHG